MLIRPMLSVAEHSKSTSTGLEVSFEYPFAGKFNVVSGSTSSGRGSYVPIW